ncbi:unnamed protein product [Nippostrongylus brasiliensis]|uniref:Basement membrane proteoglycan (inferred by orthology to a C. elegans protein) n=1 Tax=Nippostrongylus brasiliensis TaxID=27835 RepID=A0A0N4XW01_NIPBR|nr:unnamed protein product [Nippostrongylus brasiliensis]
MSQFGPSECAVFRWTRVGGPLPPHARESSGRLTINPVSLSDSGTYVCVSSHNGRTVEAQATLHVQSYGPQEMQSVLPSSGQCMADERACGNNECVKADYVCDGEPDCRDRSDELNCPALRQCEPNEFKCHNQRCVQKMWLCDGDDDCGDNSDELNCGAQEAGEMCKKTEFQCHDQRQCVPSSFHCDGTNDCRDGSDEVGCVQPTVVEPPETNKQVAQGSTFQLTCKAVAVPEAYINWRLNWGPVCEPPRCIQASEGGYGTLTVNNAQYVCVNITFSNFSGFTASFEVDDGLGELGVVADRFRSSSVVVVVVGERLGGERPVVVRQEKNEEKPMDQGAYTCEAINVKGRVLATPDCIVRIVNIPAPQPTMPPPVPQTRCDPPLVTGPTCSDCRPGSFHLTDKSPQGCLKCFCFGITENCRSSNYYRTQASPLNPPFLHSLPSFSFKDRLMFAGSSEGVMLSDVEERDIDRSANFEFSIPGYLTYTQQPVGTKYWRMPQRFLGNKVTSYGGKMEFEIQYSGDGPLNRDAMVVLKGNQIVLAHHVRDQDRVLQPDRPNKIVLETYETNFVQMNGAPASREDLMMFKSNHEKGQYGSPDKKAVGHNGELNK